jgi:hypothetical protein
LVKVRLLLPPEQTHGLGQLVESLCAALQVLGPPHGLEVQQDDPQALVPEPDQQEPDLHPQDPALHEGMRAFPGFVEWVRCDAMACYAICPDSIVGACLLAFRRIFAVCCAPLIGRHCRQTYRF